VIGGTEPVAVGSPMPQFSLPELAGGCFDSADYEDRALIINFWASWCAPCRTEFPLLAEAREKYRTRGVEVIGVVSRDIASDAQRFADERDVEWPLVDDDDEIVGQAFGVRSIPETFFVAPDGTVTGHLFGFTSKRDLEREVDRMLRG
jgi:cytochrome c biogenesis protein CcmG/thiol:disulfide interchange protein DsbE